MQEKAWPHWQPISGGTTHGTDFWGRPDPTANDLVRSFNDMVYSCTSLIANNIATVPIRLYVTTEEGQARPKCATRQPTRKALENINQKRLGRSTRVEEVVSHPVLDLLNTCNSYHNYLELIQLTQLYLDVTGNAFWYVCPDQFGLPMELYLLPTQQVEPIRDEKGFVIGWTVSNGMTRTEYPAASIIHFKYPSLTDPYGMGFSPVQSAWNRIQIGNKEAGYLDATLTNNARPDALLIPNEPISPFEAERLQKDYFQRFRGQGSGGIMVADGPMQLTPLSWPPKNLAEFELFRAIRLSVSNAFGIPPDVWELGQSNRSSAEAVLYALAVHSIKPRMARIVEKLNERLIPFYDSRLFFEADSPVPEDKQFILQENQMLVNTCSITRDELRQRYGYDSAEWAKTPLLPPGSMPAESALAMNAEVPIEYTEPTVDRSAQAPIIASLQAQVNAGQISREAAIANVVLTMGFTQDQAQALFPDVPPKVIAPEQPAPDPVPAKALATKAIKRKSPAVMAQALTSFFRHQKAAILGTLKTMDEVQTKAVDEGWFDLTHWTEQMAEAMRPVVQIYYDHSAKQTVSRIGASWELLKVTQPKLKEGMDKATFLFCKETNETTSQELGAAIKQLKESLTQGMAAGEYGNQLTKRVGEIFDQAEVYRSWRIAQTEASRAQHTAQFMVAQESGIVQGKRWILSSDACDKCKPLANRVVPLDKSFATVDFGNPAYSDIQYPPLHPECRCDAIEVIEGVND